MTTIPATNVPQARTPERTRPTEPNLDQVERGYSPLMEGHRGDAVRQAQHELAVRGFLRPEEVDGRFGPRTRRAVEEFQRANALQPDGKIGPLTHRALFRTEALSPDDFTRGAPPQPDALTRLRQSWPQSGNPAQLVEQSRARAQDGSQALGELRGRLSSLSPALRSQVEGLMDRLEDTYRRMGRGNAAPLRNGAAAGQLEQQIFQLLSGASR